MSSKNWSNMICDICLMDKNKKDFFKGNTSCYSCIYKKKIKEMNPKTLKNYCRICAKEVFFDKKAKKRQRNVFCSEECAQKGHKELLKNYWTRQVKRNPVISSCYQDARRSFSRQDYR